MKCVCSFLIRAAASEIVVVRERWNGPRVDGEIVKHGSVAAEH